METVNKPRRHVVRSALVGLLTTGLVVTGGLAFADRGSDAPTTYSQSQTLPQPETTHDDAVTPAATGETVDASQEQESGLVYITSIIGYGAGKSAGTGMILTGDGEILTNHHVIEGATSIEVEIVSTGKTYRADVIGYDDTHDVAVLQLRGASGLDAVEIDSTSTVQIGDAVVGVGNANGDGGAASASAGSVTALDDSITVQSENGAAPEQLSGLIKTNAHIISGDSGGPLYDADGEVIGMDTAASSGGEVAGYAIPIGDALEIAEQITSGDESGAVDIGNPAFLGVQLSSFNAGAVIAGTVDDSPAAAAGIDAGDTITSLDGAAISSAEQLSEAISAHDPGDSVSVTWVDRSGASHDANVTLDSGPVS